MHRLLGGRHAVKELLRQMVRWRVSLRWYLVALGLPLLLGYLTVSLNRLLGAPNVRAGWLAPAVWPSFFFSFTSLLLVPGIGGAWEEPGWRGYALPALARKHDGSIAVTLLLAGILVVWHLPLAVSGIIPLADPLFVAGTVPIFNWLYVRTKRSLLLVMLLHAMNNALGLFVGALYVGADLERLALLRGLVWFLLGLLLVLGRRRHRAVEAVLSHLRSEQP